MTTTTNDTATDPADVELKAKHRTMWGLGDYAGVKNDLIPELGAVLVEASGIRRGDRVLDVGAGTGNAAIPAARAGARVVASDLTPSLLAAGKAEAGEQLAISWEEGDAEALPYEPASFDAVISCVGVMFAPHHQAAADELVRVCRPGGRIGLANWTPEGFIGQMFACLKPYAPAPPPGAQPPLLWGSEAHVTELLGDRVRDLELVRRSVSIDRFTSPADFREYFKANYGPTIAAYRVHAADTERTTAMDEALDTLAERAGAGSTPMEWEYLLVTAYRS